MRNTRGNVRRRLATIMVLGMVFVGLLANAPLVRAADEPQFGIRPATPNADPQTSNYFVIKALNGETIKDAILVANPGTVPVKVLLYPVDATSGQNGGAVYLSDADARKDVGAWIKLEATAIEVPPQKQTTVNFTIDVPVGVSPGQHLGGIAAQLDRPKEANTQGGTSFGITTVTRAVTAVLVNIGDTAVAPSLRITGAQVTDVDGLPTLTLSLNNDGTTLLKSRGDVTMLDATGKPVLTSQLTIDTLLPQTTVAYPVQAEPPSQPGTYRVRATLDFGGSAPAVFEGPVVVRVRPTATPIVGAPAGRARPTPVASTPAAVISDASKGGISPTTLLIFGLGGALVAAVAGLTVVSVRSKSRKQQ